MNQWNSWLTRKKQPAKRPRVKHMIGSWRVTPGHQVRECFARRAIQQSTRETFFLAKSNLLYQIRYPHYKYPYYPWIVRSAFQRENSSKYTWELEIVIPTIIYTFPCGFPQTPTSPSLDPWEVVSPNTNHTYSECQVRFWCYWEALERANHWQMQSGWIVGFGKLEKTRLREVRW